MKTGQLMGQIFIYILAVILTAVILGYGYKAVVTFKQKSEQVSYIQFKTELQNAVESITSDFGSVKILDLSVPGNFEEVCFVKTYPSDIPETITNNKYPIISDSTSSNVEKNVFLVETLTKESFYIGKINVDPDLYCINVLSGRVRLRLEGMGDHTKISKMPLV